ncbi:Ribosomal L1 domain-containing protein 1 [Chamberlinius hualienensis]
MIANIEESVEQALKALEAIENSKQQISEKKPLLTTDEDDKIFLTIELMKIPFVKYGYTKVYKLPLIHSVFGSSTSVCLFVKDLSPKRKTEHDLAKMHYEDLLRKNDVNRISQIIPLHELITEYKPYEAKRKLCHSHDLFLTEQAVASFLPSFIGNEFWKSKKLPVAVNLKAQDLSKEFEKIFQQTYFHFTGRGSVSSFHVANACHSPEQVIENVTSALNELVKVLPGGLNNIRTIRIKKSTSMAIPIYISTVVKAEELSTKLNTMVKVYPDGRVRVVKNKRQLDGEDDGSEEEDDEDDCDYRKLIPSGKRFKRPKFTNKRINRKKPKVANFKTK